jgi:hypothetical protein
MNLPRFALALGLLTPLGATAWAQSPQATQIMISPHTAGTFAEAMSTSFQVAPWTDRTFIDHPDLIPLLNRLNPHHIRVQVIDAAIPETAPNRWDFGVLDRQLQPILSAADHSPEIQLAAAPGFLYSSKTHFVTPDFIAGFTDYAAGMVRHYNAPDSPHPIHFWGILNEPDYFNISPAEYLALYNAAVPAMKAADPTIAVVALELGGNLPDEKAYIPSFVRGVTAPVDILGVHFYATCDRLDTDETLMNTIPDFVQQLNFIRATLQTNGKLASIPIWILENNVNADFVDASGHSPCNPTHTFQLDPRGSSPFFAAWRAYEFSQFGKAGASALYHWVFAGDRQYGEINTVDSPLHPQISYWIDRWLGAVFPPEVPWTLLTVNNPSPGEIEVLAVRQPDGSVAILIANHEVGLDRNGSGIPRSINLELSPLGHFQLAELVEFGAATHPDTGPTHQTFNPTRQIQLHLDGYGVILLRLTRTGGPK